MLDAKRYCDALIARLREAFGDELCYVGLQGSYLRGEATERSDIDVMVILENVTPAHLDVYRDALEAVGDSDRSCGFLCARVDMAAWNRLEIGHLLHTTRDLYGRLEDFVPPYTRQDVCAYVKLSVGNLYHELCHRYIHRGRERSAARLHDAIRPAFFALQNLHYLDTGEFIATKAELLAALDGDDREVLALSLAQEIADFDAAFALLLRWCQHTLARAA